MSEIKESRLLIHDEDGYLWAEVDELPGCFAAGRNMEELKEALEEAISIYLAPTKADRKRVILEFLPESSQQGMERLPARFELAAA